jgi:hypothetical protein
MAGGIGMVLGNARLIDAVLNVKAIWIAVCFKHSKICEAARELV